MTLKCALRQSQPHFVKLSKAWSQTVKQQMSQIVKEFSEMHVEVLQNVWAVVSSTPGAVSGDLFCDYAQETSRVVLAGPASRVHKAAERLRTEAKKITEKMDIEKRTVTEKVQICKKAASKLLNMHNIPQTVMDNHPNVQVKVEMNEGVDVLQLTGLPGQLAKAKIEIFQFVEKVKPAGLSISPRIGQLLQDERFAKHAMDALDGACVYATWEVTGERCIIHAADDDMHKKAKEILANTLSEKTISVGSEHRHLLQTPDWDRFQREITSTSQDMIKLDTGHRDKLIVFGLPTAVDSASQYVQQYLERHAIKKKHVKVTNGTARLLSQCLQEDILPLNQNNPEFGLRCQADGPDTVLIEGNFEGIEKVTKLAEEIKKQIATKEHQLEKPGMQEIFNSERGKHFCHSVESRYSKQATVDILKQARAKSLRNAKGSSSILGATDDRSRPSSSEGSSSMLALCSTISTQEGVKVTLKKGSIEKEKVMLTLLNSSEILSFLLENFGLDNSMIKPWIYLACRAFVIQKLAIFERFCCFQVDTIVNATSRDLKLDKSATSKALLHAGGPTLQQECDMLGPNGVAPGEIVATNGGGLSCQRVYHGPLVKYDTSQGRAIQVILSSFLSW